MGFFFFLFFFYKESIGLKILFTFLLYVCRYECPPGCLHRSGKVAGTGYYDMVNDHPQTALYVLNCMVHFLIILSPEGKLLNNVWSYLLMFLLNLTLRYGDTPVFVFTAAIQCVWSRLTLWCHWRWWRMAGCDETRQKAAIHQIIQEWYSINWVGIRLCT